MLLRRYLSFPRLARNTLVSLLDQHLPVAGNAPIRMTLENAIFELDGLVWQKRHVAIEGRVYAGRVEVGFEGRAPVASSSDRLSLRLPRPQKSAGLTLKLCSTRKVQMTHVPAPARVTETLAQLAALPKALGDVWRARKPILFFIWSGDQTVAASLRRQLGLTGIADTTCAVPDNLFTKSRPNFDAPPVTIIVPVFNAVDDTKRLLSVLPEALAGDTCILFIDDGSSDARIAPMLDRFAMDYPKSTVIKNSENIGFIGSVNAGISAVRADDHVIILNTDTLPPPVGCRAFWLPLPAMERSQV